MLLFKTVLFSLLVPCTVVGLVPYLLLTGIAVFPLIDLGSIRYCGVLPMITGIIFYIASARSFVVQGKGTPVPIDPPRRLVASGLYRITRNPMYVGGLLVLLGEAILFEAPILIIYLLFIWLVFHLFVIFYEEPHLVKQFGPAYEEYCRKVPRWVPAIFPKLFR